jgi:dTDP-4-dehydrorhamnose 3,5-epimerase-like enzyme
MRRLDTRLGGLVLLEPDLHGDARGFFLESYRANVWARYGVGDGFVYGEWESFELDDEQVAISWPREIALLVSQRDLEAPALREIAGELPF